MSIAGVLSQKVSSGLLFLGMVVGTAIFAVPIASASAPEASARTAQTKNPEALLALADSLKTSDHDQFVKLLGILGKDTPEMNAQQTWYLRYLTAWQVAYQGDYDQAEPLLRAVISQPMDQALQFRATATLINILGISHHYEEAFSLLNQAVDELPYVTDKYARYHVTAEAAQLLSDASQYDLAISYANQIIADYPQGRNACTGYYIELHAELENEHMQHAQEKFQHGMNVCTQAGEGLIADSIRRDLANFDLQRHRTDAAITLLQSSYANVLSYQYPDLTTEYNALLSQGYWESGDAVRGEQYANAALKSAVKGEFSEPLSRAYNILYQIAEHKGDLRNALTYHEQYMAADQGRVDETKEKMLAYQMVKQQVDAKKAELLQLNKQNEILQLQQALDHKAMVTSRLYIALLLTVLASIGFWLYRLKRSQLRFMRLARRDGLTGIFNRQHFVDEAEQALRYVGKSARTASLLLIDMDHFKSINDTYGHQAGDQVLMRAVAICQSHLRSSDVFGRLGGEEFGVLLPECDHDKARERAEQLRAAIQAEPPDEADPIAISASFGVASTIHHGYELRGLLVAADAALYRAKREGRNRVVVNNACAGDDMSATFRRSQYKTGADGPIADPVA